MTPEERHEQITQVQAQHSDELMKKPYVIGTAIGYRQQEGHPTDEMCLVVMVSRKVAQTDLPQEQRVPEEIDGVPVEVREMGNFTAYTT